jgi:hypothetical protein
MSMPKIEIGDINRDQAISHVLASIALEEAALSHVINAEGEKLQAAIAAPGVTNTELLDVNSSVSGLLGDAASIEESLKEKLTAALSGSGIPGPAGPAGPIGPIGPAGPSGISEFASLMNDQPLELRVGDFLSFSRAAVLEGLTVDAANETLTLGTARYCRIHFGVNVQSYGGGARLEMVQDGVGTGIYVPICENGISSLDWIASYPPNTKIQFKLDVGGITLGSPGGCNAFLVVEGYRI